ncbi:M23 family metallopeptidase [Erysipelotrichaceae bacterium HCN-30851]
MHSAVIKSITVLLTDKDVRKFGAKLLLVIISPLLLIVMLFTSIGAGASEHNKEVIDTLFEYKAIPASAPAEFRQYMETMQTYFRKIDEQADVLQQEIDIGALDTDQMKALFLAMFLEEPIPAYTDEDMKNYTLCFVKEKASNDDSKDEANDKDKDTEDTDKDKKKYSVIYDLSTIAENIRSRMSFIITEEMINNYQSIIGYVNPGMNASTDGEGIPLSEEFADIIEESKKKPYAGGSMGSPFADGWQAKVTSEFGSRSPITLPDGTVTDSVHTGMDMGAAGGTPILAVNDGTVVYVRNHSIGLGLHLAIDHGGGILSVYGHTSRIIVKEGDEIKKGQKIAEVGTTGYSTGNHLHLEIWEDGKAQNPRNYLEQEVNR